MLTSAGIPLGSSVAKPCSLSPRASTAVALSFAHKKMATTAAAPAPTAAPAAPAAAAAAPGPAPAAAAPAAAPVASSENAIKLFNKW